MNQLATVDAGADLPAVPPQPDAMTLVGQAINSGQPMENIQQLIDLVKFNDQREALRQFNQAFTAAQAEFPAIRKGKHVRFENRRGDITEYNFASYKDIVEAVRPVLSRHNLSFRHDVKRDSEGTHITCILAHQAGHNESASLTGPADESGGKNSIQGVGSTVTYLKRYTLEAVTGVVTTDDDTDGNLPPSQELKLISADQANKIHAAIEENGLDMERWLDRIEKATGERSIASITADGFPKVWNTLQKAIKAKEAAQ